MKFFVAAEKATEPKSDNVKKVAYMYAFLLVAFVLCQLYSFDEFLALLQSYMLPGGDLTANLLGAVLVIAEVMALPFLLGMSLSPLMRVVSMVFSWIVPIAWLKMALWLIMTVNAVNNIGYMGTVVKLAPGWWAVFFSLSICSLAAWASWGMWPLSKLNKLKK